MKISKFLVFIVILYIINCQLSPCTTPEATPDKCAICKNSQKTFDGRNCFTCTNTETQIKDNGYCYTKVANCKEYLTYDDFCKICKDDYERDEFGKCNKCKDNQIGKDNVCYNKIENCEKYGLFKEGKKCIECQKDYELNSAQTKCIQCKEGFQSLNGIKCVCKESGKIEISGKCFDVITGCEKYTNKGDCSKCYNNEVIGYYILNDGKCYNIPNCIEYNGYDNCKKCKIGYELVGDSKKTCSACTGKFGDDGEKCYNIIANCDTQLHDSCQKCLTGYEKVETEQNSGKYKCSQCTDGKIGDDGEDCYNPIAHCAIQLHDECKICETDYKLSANSKECDTCTNEEKTAGQVCHKYIANCETYEGYDSCQKCNNGFKLMATDVKNECDTCGENKIGDGENCYDKINNCDIQDEDSCEKCKTGYKIVVRGGKNLCEKCGENKIGDGENCYDEIANCDTQVQDSCQKCNVGYKKVETAADSGKYTCSLCTDGKIGDDGEDCYAPIAHCAIQLHDTCTICATDYKWDTTSNECVECTEADNAAGPIVCHKYIENCVTYAGYDSCQACNVGYKKVETASGSGKYTCSECTAGQIGDDGIGCYTPIEHCEIQEHDSCQTCNAGYGKVETPADSGKYTCSPCTGEQIGDDGIGCYTPIEHCAIQEHNQCTICETDYKLTATSTECVECTDEEKTAGEVCHKYIENCVTYEGYDSCQKCNNGFKLDASEFKNNCEKCSSYEIGNGERCIKYISEHEQYEVIENCDEQEKDKCLKCEEDYELSTDKTKCTLCTDGKTSEGLSCFKIDNCETYGYHEYGNIYGCKTCESNSIYLTTTKQQCNDELGKYKLGNEFINEISNCLEYKSKTECKQCLPGYKIKNGKCYPCVEPYEGSDGKTCYLPHLNCDTDETGKCSQCTNGYELTKNKQYCYLKGTNDPTNNSCQLFKLNILLLMIFGLLI